MIARLVQGTSGMTMLKNASSSSGIETEIETNIQFVHHQALDEVLREDLPLLAGRTSLAGDSGSFSDILEDPFCPCNISWLDNFVTSFKSRIIPSIHQFEIGFASRICIVVPQ